MDSVLCSSYVCTVHVCTCMYLFGIDILSLNNSIIVYYFLCWDCHVTKRAARSLGAIKPYTWVTILCYQNVSLTQCTIYYLVQPNIIIMISVWKSQGYIEQRFALHSTLLTSLSLLMCDASQHELYQVLVVSLLTNGHYILYALWKVFCHTVIMIVGYCLRKNVICYVNVLYGHWGRFESVQFYSLLPLKLLLV